LAASGEVAPEGVLPAFGLLDDLAESVLAVTPIGGRGGKLADFEITHLSPGYVDPAGREPRELVGLTLLQAYPGSAAGGGLFARAAQVLAGGGAQRVPGEAGPLTGTADAVPVADLRATACGASVVFTWRRAADDGRLAELLDHVQRVGQLGGWEEDFALGFVRWTDAAFAVFGLDPAHATAIPLAELDNYVIAADQLLVRRFRQTLLLQRAPAAAVFRIVRPQDGAVRQIRVFAEPVHDGGEIIALRGAFQDVSALYHTQVALAATRTRLADTEQRAAEEHELAIRLQRAIMPGERHVDADGLDIAVRYRPAEAGYLVAGDWYDTLEMPDGDLLLIVGDIAGHGIAAVTGMVTARNALRGLAATGASPRELLSQLNYAASLFTKGITGTVVCGRYNPCTRMLRWARAGHLPPVLVRDGVATVQPTPDGMLIGVMPDAEYEELELQLLPGDTLLLYTDGLIERRAASISDALAEFAAAAVPAGPDADSYAARILAGAGSDTGDDACLVAVRIL
jgi:serine phosphatase RsbU (regulator of sigma subunit)/PAS domain-containing protein